jgi:RPEL repeat
VPFVLCAVSEMKGPNRAFDHVFVLLLDRLAAKLAKKESLSIKLQQRPGRQELIDRNILFQVKMFYSGSYRNPPPLPIQEILIEYTIQYINAVYVQHTLRKT